MIRKIQHIGIAVNSLQEAVPFFRDVLGLEHERPRRWRNGRSAPPSSGSGKAASS